jgi:Family of unknown function (DUF5694)
MSRGNLAAMNSLLRFLSVTLAFAVCSAQTPALAEKPQIMIVGVAHLVSKHDIHNSTFTDSPLSAARQEQIRDVVMRLARFQPTKVLVEEPFGDPVWNQRYLQYRARTFALQANEVYQFGFRLAASCNNPAIYPIDTFGPTLIGDDSPDAKRIGAYLTAHFASIASAPFNAFIARQDVLEETATYLDLLRYLNSDEAVDANASFYAVLAGEGQLSANAGAANTAQWYTRNTYIYVNIMTVVQPGDRVAIIMGQGHKYLLRQFVKLNPNVTYVDALDYLR